MRPQEFPEKRLAKGILITAAIYHLLWGALALIFPAMVLGWIGAYGDVMTPFTMQFLGIVTFSMGVAYWVASSDPLRQWAVSLAATVFNVICFAAFVVGLGTGVSSTEFWPLAISNWAIWIPAFLFVLYLVYQSTLRADQLLIDTYGGENNVFPLELFDTVQGENLSTLTNQVPVMLVFLRHFGCPFCKDTLDHVAAAREKVEANGVRLVFVYMITPAHAKEYLSQWGLDDVAQISDPESILYKRFELRRGSLTELFGMKALSRFAQLLFRQGYTLTEEAGDVYQMPGVFVMNEGRVTQSFIHRSAADRPDFVGMAQNCCS